MSLALPAVKPDVGIRRRLDHPIGMKPGVTAAVEKQRRRLGPREGQHPPDHDLVVAAFIKSVGLAFERHEAVAEQGNAACATQWRKPVPFLWPAAREPVRHV